MKTVIISTLFLSFTLFSVGAHGSELNVPSAELERLSVEWMDAMLNDDKPRLEELMAPEFVLHTSHPEYPETPRERWLDNLFNHLEIERWEQTDISAFTFGDIGVVMSTYGWGGSMFGDPFEADGHCTDVWQLQGDRWRVVSRTCLEF